MTRNLLWIASGLIVAAAMILGTDANRAAAQEDSAGGAAEADAGAGASQSDQSSSNGASESAGAQSQADTSSSADTSGSASTDASSSSATSGDAQSATQDAATSTQTDAASQTDVDTSATQSQDQAPANQNQQSTETDVRGDASANVDAKDQGRANVDARGRANVDAQGQSNSDAQGRNARGRANDNRGDRNVRGDRDNQRQRDVSAGIRFGRASDRGLAIDTIDRGSVFFDSGIRRGDIIVSYGGRPIRSHDEFRRWAVYRPGQRVPVIILRDGRRETVYITYHDDAQHRDNVYADAPSQAPGYLGVVFDARIPDAAVLATVHAGSPAQEAGLQPGDDIIALNEQEVRSFQDAVNMLRAMRPGDEVAIDFARQAEPGARPMEDRTMAVLAARPAQDPRLNVRREVRVYRGGPQYDRRYSDDRRYDDRRYDDDRVERRVERLIDGDDRDDRRGDDRGDRGLLERALD